MAAVLSFGWEKSLNKKLAVASCSFEISLWFLNKVAMRDFFPIRRYQNKQLKGSFVDLYSIAATYSIILLSYYLLSYQRGRLKFFIHYHEIGNFYPFYNLSYERASSLFKEWERSAMFIELNEFLRKGVRWRSIIDCVK